MEEGARFVRINHRILNLNRIVDAHFSHHHESGEASEHDTLTVRFAGETQTVEYADQEARALWHALWQQARDVSHLGQRPLPEE